MTKESKAKSTLFAASSSLPILNHSVEESTFPSSDSRDNASSWRKKRRGGQEEFFVVNTRRCAAESTCEERGMPTSVVPPAVSTQRKGTTAARNALIEAKVSNQQRSLWWRKCSDVRYGRIPASRIHSSTLLAAHAPSHAGSIALCCFRHEESSAVLCRMRYDSRWHNTAIR